MGVSLVLKYVENDTYLQFMKPIGSFWSRLKKLLDDCIAKNNGYVCITIDKVRKPRTTGGTDETNQNGLVWKLISLIAVETGDDSKGMSDTERGLKERAMSRGYPYKISKITGRPVPLSMTKIDTQQCSILIETAYQICAELNIVIPPDLRS